MKAFCKNPNHPARVFTLYLCFQIFAPHVLAAERQSPIQYTVSLSQSASHLVHVKVTIPAGASQRDLQLPVWNALYQIRDFSQYINWIHAKDHTGRALPLRQLERSRWRVDGAEGGAEIEYEILADDPGPYGAQLNSHHAFFNLAEILIYSLDARGTPVKLHITDYPSAWRIACALQSSAGEFSAADYDHLVDAPVEIGVFQESDFAVDGAHYRVVVDAESSAYNMQKVVSTVQRIVTGETVWMNDRPFQSFLFLYHFPHTPGGGMEHAYSTAIDVNAQVLADDPLALADVTAHEFFHLWNVKRIRPQSLEPVDYTKENYTTALWFSEGLSNTLEDYTLLRAGFIEEPQYLSRLAASIGELERRPAHLTQSVEEASLNAWLEKYDYYRTPGRSISYYNKGELLGVLLDLNIREASHGTASLREVFQWLNTNYAKQGRFFPDSAGVREAAEAVSHADFKTFFQKYVAGTDEIPWDDFFHNVGLHLQRRTVKAADAGFSAVRNINLPPFVVSIQPGSEAQNAGLSTGDSILEINGRTAGADFESQLLRLRVGDTVRLRIRNTQGKRELHWKTGSREQVYFELQDVANITPEQKAARTAWLKGATQAGATAQ